MFFKKRILLVFCIIYCSRSHAMEQEPFEPLSVALGGAYRVAQRVACRPYYSQLIELRLLMLAVINGIHLHADDAIVLPGYAATMPLYQAAAWTHRAIELASDLSHAQQPIISSMDSVERACQEVQQRLWHFVCCDDLQSLTIDPETLELLYKNRMLRITSLVSQNRPFLKQAARAPVTIADLEKISHKGDQAISEQREHGHLVLSPEKRTKKITTCFAIKKNK